MSLDKRLETYVQQHNIVDIEFDHAEYDKDDDVDDSDEEEGVDIDDNAFLELILEEDDMQRGKHDLELNLEKSNVQLGNLNSNDGLVNTGRHDDDGDVHSINEVLAVNPPPIVLDPPPVYCQITSDSPPTVDNEHTEPPCQGIFYIHSPRGMGSRQHRTVPPAIGGQLQQVSFPLANADL